MSLFWTYVCHAVDLTFRQLETFADGRPAEAAFTRAAEALHLTQPAVSIQIRQITESARPAPVRTKRPRESR
jgi:hypothetical protein